jgi:hypothetical protein
VEQLSEELGEWKRVVDFALSNAPWQEPACCPSAESAALMARHNGNDHAKVGGLSKSVQVTLLNLCETCVP